MGRDRDFPMTPGGATRGRPPMLALIALGTWAMLSHPGCAAERATAPGDGSGTAGAPAQPPGTPGAAATPGTTAPPAIPGAATPQETPQETPPETLPGMRAGAVITSPYDDPVVSVSQAKTGVFIQPYELCQPSLDDVAGRGPGGQVCTQVAISGATEAGRYFGDYASCDVVRTQRPFWEEPPADGQDPGDPRLSDADYMAELAWAKAQVEASGCVCCHDSRQGDGRVGQWDVAVDPVWIRTLSDTGLALFAGFADSSALGAYPAERNNGFARERTGIPSDDPERMAAFLDREVAYRGLTEAQLRAVPPFGGPIYEASVAVAEPCGPGQGIAPDGTVSWTGGSARYLFVLAQDADNPGVPPNRDLPEGTLWRLDVRPDADAVGAGLAYGESPAGTVQRIPASGAPPALMPGTRYKLAAQLDVGFPVTNCVFEFGQPLVPVATPPPPATAPPSTEEPVCAADAGFGASCMADADCGCAAAPYCAIMPGQASGLCTATGCVEDPSVCPDGWSCFDISIFAPGQPSICVE